MEIERWNQIGNLFSSALEVDLAEREEFLKRECEGDTELFQEVQSLLAAHEQPGSFLGNSAFELCMQMLNDEQANLQSSTLGHYKIIKPIGSGGMGEVFLAEDPRLGRRVAIKLLPRSSLEDPARIYRFQQEARAASSISHPNIAHIYETGVDDGYHFTSMEFIDGITLRRLMDQRRLELKEAIDIALQVAAALVAAHASGIIHRDIKPDNIMIHRDGHIKVLDFGLAKLTDRMSEQWNATTLIDAVETQPGMIMGSPAYMSPEQARGLEVDARTDIWSLGIVLYEMVTGWTPFHGSTNMDVLAGVLKEAPTPINEHLDNVPPGLEKVLKKMLSKDKDERYLSSVDMLADLKNLARSMQSGSEPNRKSIELLKACFRSIAAAPLRYVFVLFVATVTLGLLVTWSVKLFSRPSIYKPTPLVLAKYEKGVDAIFADDLYEATEALDHALRLDDRFALARLRAANVLKDLGHTAVSMGEFQTAQNMIAILLKNDKPLALDEIDALYFRALSHSQEGDYDLAARTFAQISTLTPDRPEIYLDLGLAHERNGDLESAISSYQKATKFNPQLAVGFMRLAVACAKKGDFAAADEALDRANYLYGFVIENSFEGQIEVLYQRSALFMKQGRMREAEDSASLVSHFATIGGNSAQKVKSSFLLASILYAQGNKDGLYYENQALTLAEDLHREELAPRGLLEIGEMFRSRHKLSEARARFEKALAKARSADLPHSQANALYALGQLYLQENQLDESIPLLEEVLRIEFFDKPYSQQSLFHWRNSILNLEYQTAIRMFKEKYIKSPTQ